MNEQVTINIHTRLKDTTNTIEERTSTHIGKYFAKDNCHYFFYEETDTTKTRLTIKGDIVEIKRDDILSYTLEFDLKNKTNSFIKTNTMGFDIVVDTKKLDLNIDDNEIKLSLEYELYTDNTLYLSCYYSFLAR